MKKLSFLAAVAMGASVFAFGTAQANETAPGFFNTQSVLSGVSVVDNTAVQKVGFKAKAHTSLKGISSKRKQGLRSFVRGKDSRAKRRALKKGGAFHHSLYFESHSGGGA